MPVVPLKDLNLRPPAKSNLMMAVVCLAYAIPIRVAWQSQQTIRRITHADASVFPAPSIFRIALAMGSAAAFLYDISPPICSPCPYGVGNVGW